MKKMMHVSMWAMLAGLTLISLPAQAEDTKEKVYGRELMTREERMQHREAMRTKDADERAKYRAEHHEQMKERADKMGKTLPDHPGERRKGMQGGQGMRQGMGGGQNR